MTTHAFAELGLNEQILAGVEALGFTTPTPVQAEAIPAVLAGRDVVASAQTGTGKTAAFALPVLQNIIPLSRTAREELLAQEPTDEGGDECPDVLADEVVEPRLVVPADDGPQGGADEGRESPEERLQTAAPARRRVTRRHHQGGAGKETPEVPEAESELAAAVETADRGPEDEAGATHPKRRRRRRRKRAAQPLPEAAGDGADASVGVPAEVSDAHGEGPAREEAMQSEKPRGRRRSRRRGAPAASAATDGPASVSESGAGAPSADCGAGTAEPTAADEKPARKRRRKRKRKASERPDAHDVRDRDPKARPFGPFALVITPTRELAQQIDNVVSKVCEHTGQRAVIVMGGAKFDRQIRALESGCDMLVATPGRLIDLMEHDHVDLSHVSVLVLDEADRMLDMGFWPSVRRILAVLPERRQNLLFSATIPASIKPTIDAMLKDPVHVEIAHVGETADTVEEHLMPVTQGQKIPLLCELIRCGGAEQGTSLERVLVFCRTKQRADDVTTSLRQAGFGVDVMHADRPQQARERALARFRAGRCQALVATDVMSRGIDVSGIDAVVNFDVPLDPEDYVHRIGRTGRAGATGHAYTFVAPDEISPLREIEYFTGQLIATWDLPGFAYDEGRIVPGATRSTIKPKRTMFSGAKARGRGLSAGRYGRHY